MAVETAEETASAVADVWAEHDILVMAAAVADYTPVKKASQKMKKSESALILQLKSTMDILADAASKKGKRIVVGFALETENENANAEAKLKKKKLDLICVNNPMVEGAAFGSPDNKVTLIDKDLKREELPLMSKGEVAEKIFDKVESLF